MNRNIKYFIIIGLIIIFLIYFPSSRAFGSDAYIGAVVKYRDGSTSVFHPNSLSIIGLNIIDVNNGKTIESITFTLEATPRYTESIYIAMYPGSGGGGGGTLSSSTYYLQLAGRYSLIIEYDYEGNVETYHYKDNVDFKTGVKQVSSGQGVEYTLVTVTADEIEAFIKSKGFTEGDTFKLYITMSSGLTGYLLDANINVVGKKVIDRNNILPVVIGLKYTSSSKLTALEVKFSRNVNYK